jgi:hypothetical protein
MNEPDLLMAAFKQGYNEAKAQSRERIAELEAALKEARDTEKRIWIDALLENIPEEKAILFRNICVSAEKARAALKGEKQ